MDGAVIKTRLAGLCDEALAACSVTDPKGGDCVPVSKALTRIISERHAHWNSKTKLLIVQHPNDDNTAIRHAWVSVSNGDTVVLAGFMRANFF